VSQSLCQTKLLCDALIKQNNLDAEFNLQKQEDPNISLSKFAKTNQVD
jgi:hypothetical protein